MAHQPSGIPPAARAAGPGGAKQLAVLLLPLVWGCTSDRTVPITAWPPPDFRLDVEVYRAPRDRAMVSRRLQVWPDGFSLYRLGGEPLHDTESGLILQVYQSVSAYQMRPEAVRFLSRKVWRRSEGIGRLDPGEVPPGELEERLRFQCRAFGATRSAVALGRAYGGLVGVIEAVNQYVPVGEEFRLPGVTVVAGENVLMEVPRPRSDLAGSLSFHLQLVERFPGDAALVRDAFALACRLGDRSRAEDLLARYRRLVEGLPIPQPDEVPDDEGLPSTEALAVFLPG